VSFLGSSLIFFSFPHRDQRAGPGYCRSGGGMRVIFTAIAGGAAVSG
jgi:hypothetical protein